LLHKQKYKEAHRYQRFESNALILSNLLPTLEKLLKPICRGLGRMVLFPHFNTACNWNLKTLLLLMEIIGGCPKTVADGEWYNSLMNLNPAAGKPKAEILVLLPKLWNPWVQDIVAEVGRKTPVAFSTRQERRDTRSSEIWSWIA
jgi:hypothetical protein